MKSKFFDNAKSPKENMLKETFEKNVKKATQNAFALGRCLESQDRGFVKDCKEEKEKLEKAFKQLGEHSLFYRLSYLAQATGRQQMADWEAIRKSPGDEALFNEGDYSMLKVFELEKDIIQEYEKNPAQFRK